MKGDFTRFTFRPDRHYSGVRMQQGRVQMDADWNEQLDIQAHRERTEMIDIIGPCGVPEGEGGFRVAPIDADGSGHGEVLAIAPGRMYVDGILCQLEPSDTVTLEGAGGSGGLSDWFVDAGPELRNGQWVRLVGGTADGDLIQVQNLAPADPEATEQRVQVSFAAGDLAPASEVTVTVQPLATYDTQPHYPDPPTATPGTWLAYLDVWERHITALDDPAIREVALGGPDTATRLRTIWQVRLHEVDSVDPGCDDFVGWAPAGGRLAARAEPGGDDSNPCIIPPEAGYRRLENQLYRVEIHDDGSGGGTPTFKWSRDNGSLVMRLVGVDTLDNNIQVSHPRSDPLAQLATDDWVEVLDDDMILNGEPGVFIQIGEINGNKLAIKDNPSGATLPETGIVRRWEGGAPVDVTSDEWIALESGVEIRFDATDFHHGDYWTIAARTITHDVEWPRDASSNEPLFLAPQGIDHHTCPLAVLEHGDDGDWSVVSDCREEFPPLTDLPLGGCCLRVDPGDDLQLAIDRVIQSGGGCICLGAGVHEHSGALRINGADNLVLHGEGNATILRLLGDPQTAEGGMVLMESRNVSLERMLLLGIDTDSVVRTYGGLDMQSSNHIRLRDLSILNATIGDPDRPTQAAVRLSNCIDISITDCALIGENGLICTLHDELPTFASLDLAPFNVKGGGVRRLRMTDSRIHFRQWGVWSLVSELWDLSGCEIRAIAGYELDGQMARLNDTQGDQLQLALPEALDELLGAEGMINTGTAVKAFLWRDCVLHDCTITASRGLEVWWYLRDQLTDCQIHSGDAGLHADWLHDSGTDRNRFAAADGNAVRFVGSYRAHIDDNHIRAGTAIVNLPWQARLFDFLDYVEEVAAIYPAIAIEGEMDEESASAVAEWLAFWLLFHQTVKILHLWSLISLGLDAFGAPALKAVLYFTLASMIHQWLLNYRERQQDANEPNETGLAAIALNISGNDIEAAAGCIRLQKLLLMGGARIATNRLHNAAGRAVQLDALRAFENVHLVNVLWRSVFKELLDNRIPGWIEALQAAGATAWVPVMERLLQLAQSWSTASEAFIEADFRIDGNSIHSRGTAVASNLWELAVARNHITLREQPIDVDDGVSVIEALSEYVTTHGLAHALHNGTAEGIRYAAGELAHEAVLNDTELRGDAAEAMHTISARVGDRRLREYANNVGMALNDGNLLALLDPLERLTERLVDGTDSHGILLRNPGCRVTDNHVLVPLDVEPLSWARGGITLTTVGGEDEQGLGSMELLALLVMMGAEMALDPVVGITETLIAGNEVIGGFGHGVHIDTPIVLAGPFGEFRWGLPDIRVSGNQVRGMGGAGIVVSDETYAVGVDILDNEVIDCSSRAKLTALTKIKGGVVISNAGECRLHNNRIVRCANGLSGNVAFGIILDTILGAQIGANQLVSNGSQTSELSGGMYLRTMADGASIHDNRLDRDRGYELRIDNDYDLKEIPSGLVLLANLYGLRDDSGNLRSSAISIQDNRIHARQGVCEVDSVNELTFAGNQVVMPFAGLASFTDIGTAIVTHNRVDVTAGETAHSLSIEMDHGALVGNVTDEPILAITPVSADIEQGLNIPKIDHQTV